MMTVVNHADLDEAILSPVQEDSVVSMGTADYLPDNCTRKLLGVLI
jgi:hypothetical protein